MLDVHPPHAHGGISGWRDFLVHIVVVTIGLLLALGLGQTVELLHHRYQVRETRNALQQERADNRQTFADQTRAWRWWLVELRNNLLVFQYLQQHPGTPREKLPGVPVWRVRALAFSSAAWDAAHQSGVIALMPRDEIEDSSQLYESLQRAFSLAYDTSMATVQAQAYELLDPDPTHLSPAQVTEQIRLVQTALVKLWVFGRVMQNVATSFPDFPPAVSRAELDQLSNPPDEATRKLLAPAETLTLERLKAAGFEELPKAPEPQNAK